MKTFFCRKNLRISSKTSEAVHIKMSLLCKIKSYYCSARKYNSCEITNLVVKISLFSRCIGGEKNNEKLSEKIRQKRKSSSLGWKRHKSFTWVPWKLIYWSSPKNFRQSSKKCEKGRCEETLAQKPLRCLR